MFNKNLIISLITFLVLMVFTSSVKHKTRNFEKKINAINSEIIVLRKEFRDAKIDYVYLSSPAQLQKYLIILDVNDFNTYDISRIFRSTEQFVIYKDKQTKLLKKNNRSDCQFSKHRVLKYTKLKERPIQIHRAE